MSEAEDIVVLPEDNGTLPADTLEAIQASDAYPETTSYKTTVEFIDFECHGKRFPQVLTILRPDRPPPASGAATGGTGAALDR